MKVRPLAIAGAFEFTPQLRGDRRGLFLEWFRADALNEAIGHPFSLAQANLSVSSRGVVRGIHYASVPPGQAKYVTCVAGAVRDVIVDLRTGSSTFGMWDSVVLDDVDRRAVYLSEGLGHGFCVLSELATISYLCSTPYAPDREHAIDPFDPEIGIDWGLTEVTTSERDAAAPRLSEAGAAGMLPSYEECLAYVSGLSP